MYIHTYAHPCTHTHTFFIVCQVYFNKAAGKINVKIKYIFVYNIYLPADHFSPLPAPPLDPNHHLCENIPHWSSFWSCPTNCPSGESIVYTKAESSFRNVMRSCGSPNPDPLRAFHPTVTSVWLRCMAPTNFPWRNGSTADKILKAPLRTQLLTVIYSVPFASTTRSLWMGESLGTKVEA